ncbi:hypothetical protein AMTRI_Chr08g165800 [Amborella trichopoda]
MCPTTNQEYSINCSLSYSPQDSSGPHAPSRLDYHRTLPHQRRLAPQYLEYVVCHDAGINACCGSHQMGYDPHSYISLSCMDVAHLFFLHVFPQGFHIII